MSAEQAAGKARIRVAWRDHMELVLPECQKGIGTVIQSPESPELIEGVRIRPISVWTDDRGYFFEIARMGQELVTEFGRQTQVSAAFGYPGTVKAFHYHLRQSDAWTVAAGMLQAALIDLRQGSKTFGARNTLYIGTLKPWQLLIPPGVAHGYKVLGAAPAVLVYLTDSFYNPDDEGRLTYNDPHLNYDWETQHK